MQLSAISETDIAMLVKTADEYMRVQMGACGVWLAYTTAREFIFIAEVSRSDTKAINAHVLRKLLWSEACKSISKVTAHIFVEAHTLPAIKRYKHHIKIA